MRLTNSMREKMLANIMADVPKVDYETQFHDAVRKKVVPLQAAAGISGVDPLRLQSPSVYVRATKKYSAHHNFPCLTGSGRGLITAEVENLCKDSELKKLVDQHHEQQQVRNELSGKLRHKLLTFHTLEKLLEAAPEFKPYVPSDMPPKATPMLPACTDIITDLTKLGWPKGKKPAAKKAPAKRTAKKGATP